MANSKLIEAVEEDSTIWDVLKKSGDAAMHLGGGPIVQINDKGLFEVLNRNDLTLVGTFEKAESLEEFLIGWDSSFSVNSPFWGKSLFTESPKQEFL